MDRAAHNPVDATSSVDRSSLGSNSQWFLDENELLTELRRARITVDATPTLPNYTGMAEVQRGGQGIVYSATHTPTRRPVAVKVLHPTALTSHNARRRFEREVELAAALRHPGVVRVYDSGATPDGRLYLTMEWVEGETLDAVAVRNNRDQRLIADLIARVAEALNHAHLHAVIHRDLKPSNIRLSRDGTPTILDFGLATASTRDLTEITATGAFLGSLPWSSPEQALGRHAQIDTRTDIYSLGVVLHQLLTGEFPYDVKSDIRTALNNIAGAPPTPLRKVRADIHEDLEVITAKCLAKEPAERYQTAAELALDLRRYLAGEPIAAKRESMWNTMRRQAVRYRVLAWAGAVVLIVSSLSLVAVMRYADTAALERDRAQQASIHAENNLRFLTQMLHAADPEAHESGRDVRVVTILDRAAATVDQDLKHDQAALADMHATIARAYAALGLFPQSEHHSRAALHIAQNHEEMGPDHPKTLEYEANVYDAMLQQSKLQEAEPLLRFLIARMDTVLGPAHKSTILARNDLGVCCRLLNKLDEAESTYRAALASAGADTDPETILALRNNLASLLHSQARYAQAQELYEQVLADRTRVSGKDHRETIVVLSNLATLHMDQGHFADAEKPLREAYESSVKVRGPDHPTTLTLQHNLAFAVENLGRTDDALILWREIVERRGRALGADHAHTLVSMSNLGSLLSRSGQGEEGERYMKQVLERRTATLGERHMDTIITMGNLANVYMNSGRPALAEPWLRKAVELAQPEQNIVPEKHWLRFAYMGNLGRCLWMQGRKDEGAPLLNTAIAELTARVGADHPQTKNAKNNLAKLQAP
ncbi:MAG TPA: serine/threonine-protein kinase [Phycisphaerales bacterium]|nr:serine/threonine-protein kinase [Phycisphaerales bacterium]